MAVIFVPNGLKQKMPFLVDQCSISAGSYQVNKTTYQVSFCGFVGFFFSFG